MEKDYLQMLAQVVLPAEILELLVSGKTFMSQLIF